MYRQFLSDQWWLLQWDWQWMVTLTFRRRVSREEAMGRMRRWVLALQTSEHIQVGYFYGLVRRDDGLHFHLLMIGSGTKNGRSLTLENVDPCKWEKKWSRYRAGAKIEIPRSTCAVAEYVASENFRSDLLEMYPYNERLLRRFRKAPPELPARTTAR
jgi:hypothetical protein